MDFKKRSELVKRIASGKLYGKVKWIEEEIPVIFSDPSLELTTESDYIYQEAYDKAISAGAINLEESFKILTERGDWSVAKDNEISKLQDDLKILRKSLPAAKFHKGNEQSILKSIKNGEIRLNKLIDEKFQLSEHTAESLAERSKRYFIIRNIVNLDKVMLDNLRLLDVLSVYYFDHKSISSSQFRELARTDPWRVYWLLSKDNGTSLFPHSSVEMTDNQYILVSWSRIYDYAYESSDRPISEIIEDDDKFDAWYQNQSQKMEDEIKKRSNADVLAQGVGGAQQVFIPADAEGAKDVYNLNSSQSRSIIRSREKQLEQKGEMKEHEFKDVQQELKMEANRQFGQKFKNG